ncbi:MAG: VWA domain-containing protein [Spirochaetales bacterium]
MNVFGNPVAFLLLLCIPLYYILKKLNFFSKPVFTLTFFDWKGQGFEQKNILSSFTAIIAQICFIAGFIAFVISLADPALIEQKKVYTSRSAEVIFVVDVSPSMAARDIANGTRLDAAKQAISLLVAENEGIAFALVSCASQAALLVPPTMDHNSFLNRLEAMQIGELGDKTALGLGISTAVYHLLSTHAPKKTIVLLTDGENNSGSVHPNTAAELAKKYAMELYIVGIGTIGSVPIEYVDPTTGIFYSGYLNSDFDSTSLRSLASIANGTYYTVESLTVLSEVFKSIGTQTAVAQSYQIEQIKNPLFVHSLCLSLLLFALSWILKRLCLREVL